MPPESAFRPLQTRTPPKELVSQLIGTTVSEVERELVLQTVIHCKGNRTRAARMLGVSIRTIRNKLREYSAVGRNFSALIDKQSVAPQCARRIRE